MFWLWFFFLIGYGFTWRYQVGTSMHWSMEAWQKGKPDSFDFVFEGLLVGSLLTILWPLYWLVRGVKTFWIRHVDSSQDFIVSFFPAPKKIETKSERAKRLKWEAEDREYAQREQIATLRHNTNKLEREHNLPLTVWKDWHG